MPIKVTTAAGTQTMTRSFTVQKVKQGPAGAAGSSDVAIFGIDSSSGDVTITESTESSSGTPFKTPYDTAIVANTDVVSSNSSGELTIASTGTYSVDVIIQIEQVGSLSQSYTLTVAVDDGAGSYTTLGPSVQAKPGGAGNQEDMTLSSVIFTLSSGSTKKIKSQILRTGGNNINYGVVNTSASPIAIIRVEKIV